MSDVSQPSTLVSLQSQATLSANLVMDEVVVLPFNAELLNVTIGAVTAPTGSAATFDILANGTSVFGGTVGNLGQAITSTSATTVYVSRAANATAIVNGTIIKVGTELMQVTGVSGAAGAVGVGGGTAQSSGGIQNDPNLYALTVTRGFNGTTAAVAAINAAVSTVGPILAAAGTATTAVALPSTSFLSAGSVIQVKALTVGSTVAGAKASICLHLVKR